MTPSTTFSFFFHQITNCFATYSIQLVLVGGRREPASSCRNFSFFMSVAPLTARTLFLLFRKGLPPLVSVSVIVLNFGLSVGLDVISRDFFFVAFTFVFAFAFAFAFTFVLCSLVEI